jgi:hypothetical protein
MVLLRPLLGVKPSGFEDSSAMLGGVLTRSSFVDRRDIDGRTFGRFLFFPSRSFHATALSKRIRLASVTRRLNNGSVASVRNVSLRIFVYAGERPR